MAVVEKLSVEAAAAHTINNTWTLNVVSLTCGTSGTNNKSSVGGFCFPKSL